MSKEGYIIEAENLFLALADKTRLRLLNLMRRNEICVCFLTEVLKVSQPKISRHLAYLRNAGIVSARREGKWINYKIVFPQNQRAAIVLQDTLKWLATQDEMQNDYEKLEEICGSVEMSLTIARAPKPYRFAEPHMTSKPKEKLAIFLL